jgi:hypothetical protein
MCSTASIEGDHMPLFRRKAHDAAPAVTLLATNGNPLPDHRVPAKLLVGAVSAPGRPAAGEAALVSGLMLGPFPVQLVQLTLIAPRATWPAPGAELPVVADPANPLNFAVLWAQVLDAGTPPPVVPPQQGMSGWDAGPDGQHAEALAQWLAAAGYAAGDFGSALRSVAPGMIGLLDQAGARYASVIRGRDAVALMQTGQPAQGVVKGVHVLPIPPQMLPSPQASMAWLTLGVTPYSGGPYDVTIRFGFRSPERFHALATVGTELPLRVDPADPRRVTIDLPTLGITPA